ncbi:MAG: hypothetical protein FJ026_17800 [Chloroflexi bacterium]|nr:hypothetical protein [Chloroflexota bacterium]
MESLQEYMNEYRRQLAQGAIQKAYRGLMEYIMALRTHWASRYPDDAVSALYLGYMDMTYFALFPPAIAARKLKVAIVFVHEAFRFEVWLVGKNRQVQAAYWKLFRDSGWGKYHIAQLAPGVDAIVEHVLVQDPDFGDLEALTAQIESGTLRFIGDVEGFLAANR